ncbi:MAG: hypothetical protein WDO16_10520 [Bacteroidota bacterium]
MSVFALGFIGMHIPFAPGVVAEWRMNEGTGTTTADASGNAYNGTLINGPTWGTGKYGQGINLDGTNDYINIADNANFTLTPTQSYSWSGWVKNNNFNQWVPFLARHSTPPISFTSMPTQPPMRRQDLLPTEYLCIGIMAITGWSSIVIIMC